MPDIFPLIGQVKHYEWGGTDFIPSLLGQPNKDNRPFAEYWLGIHPQGPAKLIDTTSLEIPFETAEPSLSFLLKVLDVKDMLSIQVHPNKEMASADFDRENQMGIPLDAPNRNYKDPNHKPELMVALSEFWLLHGFRPNNSLHEILISNDFLSSLHVKWEVFGSAGLYRWLMEMPQEEVNGLLREPLIHMLAAYRSVKLKKSEPAFWAARAVDRTGVEGDIDRGIFSIFLFNLLKLERGEAIFQGAGIPHAYLEGRNVEIMANSDNVLRGGLTPKYIDVPELLRHVRTDPVAPQILSPDPNEQGICNYPVPVDDFSLRSVQLLAGRSFTYQPPISCILLLPEGLAELTDGEVSYQMGAGSIGYYLRAQASVTITAVEPCFLFIASSGHHSLS